MPVRVVGPDDVERAVRSNADRGKSARVLAEARAGQRTDEVIGHQSDADDVLGEGRTAVVRDGEALNSLPVYGIQPDDEDGSIRTDLDRRSLAPAYAVVVEAGADGQRVAEGGAAVGRAREHDLVADEQRRAERRPGGVDVIAERAGGVSVGSDGVLVVEDRRRGAAYAGCRGIVATAVGGLGDEEVGLLASGRLRGGRREGEGERTVVGVAGAVESLGRVAEGRFAEGREVDQAPAGPRLTCVEGGI